MGADRKAGDFPVHFQRSFGGFAPRELRRADEADTFQAGAPIGIAQDGLEGGGDGEFVGGVKENARFARYFGDGGPIGTDDGATACHGFKQREAKTFVKRGEGEAIAGVIEFEELFIGHEADEVDAVGDAG